MRTKPDNNLKYVKDVLIVALFHKRLRHRCVDDSTFRTGDESLIEVAGVDVLHSIYLTKLESNLCYLLGGLADNNLQSFRFSWTLVLFHPVAEFFDSWNLGICMPKKVSSYLSKKQNKNKTNLCLLYPTQHAHRLGERVRSSIGLRSTISEAFLGKVYTKCTMAR